MALAFMALRGQGMAADEARAARSFLAAAERGLRPAQTRMGLMLEQGRGVPAPDAEAALLWFLVASNRGDDVASAGVERLEGVLTPEAVARARNAAREWRPVAD